MPCRESSLARRVTHIRVSTGAMTATATERARSRDAFGRPRRASTVRDTCSMRAGWTVVRVRNASTSKRASALSRRATTVADRGARSISPTSPTISPRAISRTSSPLWTTSRRPLTSRNAASEASPSTNSSSPASRRTHVLDAAISVATEPSTSSSSLIIACSRCPSMRSCAVTARVRHLAASSSIQRSTLARPTGRTTHGSTARTVAVRAAAGEHGDLTERRARPDDVDACLVRPRGRSRRVR